MFQLKAEGFTVQDCDRACERARQTEEMPLWLPLCLGIGANVVAPWRGILTVRKAESR